MYQAFDIGTTFRIAPPGAAATGDRINLIMERGAFGSGEHETTISCLELLEQLPDLNGIRVLDLGSGTGILAIAALKLGADSALCVDISADAVANCQQNCLSNGVADRVTHRVGSLEDLQEDQFDLVLANIYGDLLLRFAPELAHRVRSGGSLLLSGILWEYNFDVRQAYERHGCRVQRNLMLEEFSSLLLQRETTEESTTNPT